MNPHFTALNDCANRFSKGFFSFTKYLAVYKKRAKALDWDA